MVKSVEKSGADKSERHTGQQQHRQTELGAGRNTAQSRVCAPATPLQPKSAL